MPNWEKIQEAKGWDNEQVELVKRLYNNRKNIEHDIKKYLAQKKYDKASKICERAIDKYYSEYSPRSYKRKYSLYEAYSIKVKHETEFFFELGDEFITKKHRVDNEYIYDVMFEGGWHGGAIDGDNDDYPHPNYGTPYWKKAPDFVEWWDKPAPRQFTSPATEIETRWNAYIARDYIKDRDYITQKVLSKYQ